MSTPMRRIRSGCCAPATSGHVAAPRTAATNYGTTRSAHNRHRQRAAKAHTGRDGTIDLR
jgi:hypothetical protein